MNNNPWEFETETEQKKHRSLAVRLKNFFTKNSVSPATTENTGLNKKAVKSIPRISNYVLGGVVLAFVTLNGQNIYHTLAVQHQDKVEDATIREFIQQIEELTKLDVRMQKPEPATTPAQQVQDFTKTLGVVEERFKTIVKNLHLDKSPNAVALLATLKKATNDKEFKDLGEDGNLTRLKVFLQLNGLEAKLLKDYLIQANIILDAGLEANLDELVQEANLLTP